MCIAYSFKISYNTFVCYHLFLLCFLRSFALSVALSDSKDNLVKHKFNGNSVTLSKSTRLPLAKLSIIANQPYPFDADFFPLPLNTDG